MLDQCLSVLTHFNNDGLCTHAVTEARWPLFDDVLTEAYHLEFYDHPDDIVDEAYDYLVPLTDEWNDFYLHNDIPIK